MRLPRMTTRRWKIAVVAVALLFGVYAGIETRKAHLRRLSLSHSEMGAAKATVVRDGDLTMHIVPPSLLDRRLIEYHVNLALKYERASHRPRLPVEPDPPEPK